MDYDKSKESADYILQRTSARPQLGVICGSGLGNWIFPPFGTSFFYNFSAALGDILENPFEIPYAEIPHFPVSTAPGHKSRLLFGLLDGVSVVLMQGRFHLYEGYTIHQVHANYPAINILIQYCVVSKVRRSYSSFTSDGHPRYHHKQCSWWPQSRFQGWRHHAHP